MKTPSFLNVSLLAFVISVFSLSFLSVGLQLNSSTQVLGESTQKANISCVEINQLFNQVSLMQRKYCTTAPTVAPRPSVYPTSYPLPTVVPSITCKTGLNGFSTIRTTCANGYSLARYSCYDGTGGTVGDGSTCYSTEILKDLASEKCAGRSSCVYPNPSLFPTYQPIPIITKYPIDPIYPIEPQPPRN